MFSRVIKRAKGWLVAWISNTAFASHESKISHTLVKWHQLA